MARRTRRRLCSIRCVMPVPGSSRSIRSIRSGSAGPSPNNRDHEDHGGRGRIGFVGASTSHVSYHSQGSLIGRHHFAVRRWPQLQRLFFDTDSADGDPVRGRPTIFHRCPARACRPCRSSAAARRSAAALLYLARTGDPRGGPAHLAVHRLFRAAAPGSGRIWARRRDGAIDLCRCAKPHRRRGSRCLPVAPPTATCWKPGTS